MTRRRPTPVIVLVWNGWEDAFACLEALGRCPDVDETWLVDNGSDVDRSREATARFPGIRTLRHAENHGWAGGYNRALRLAVEEGRAFAYLLNDDAVPRPGFLAAIERELEARPRLATAGSWVYRTDGTVQDYTRRWPLGSGMGIRLAAFEACGGFDERYFCYREEIEWARRVRRSGWEVTTCPASRIVHDGGGSDRRQNRLYYVRRNTFLDLEERAFPGRLAGRARLAYRLWRFANEHRRRGEAGKAAACVEALRDGILGRYGRRPDGGAGRLWLTLARTWPFPPRPWTGAAERRRSGPSPDG